jgi:hypothetical protein
MLSKTILGYLFGVSVILSLGAYIAKIVTLKISGIRASYGRAVLSTGVGYLAANIIGVAFAYSGIAGSEAKGGLFMIGWILLSASHYRFLRDNTEKRLSIPKALAVTASQVVGSGISIALLMLIVIGTVKILS